MKDYSCVLPIFSDMQDTQTTEYCGVLKVFLLILEKGVPPFDLYSKNMREHADFYKRSLRIVLTAQEFEVANRLIDLIDITV